MNGDFLDLDLSAEMSSDIIEASKTQLGVSPVNLSPEEIQEADFLETEVAPFQPCMG